MGRSVFLVTRGDYSDYSVLAVFSTRAVAEVVAERVGGEVDERHVYDEDPPRHVIYAKEYDGRRDRGTPPRDWQFVNEDWDGTVFHGPVVRGVGIGHYSADFYRYWGEDKAAVHKAFDDYHAEQQAKRAGIA